MTTERMIRAVEAVAEKHKNDSVYTCQTNITNMCRDIIPKLELLAAYEAIGTVAECQKAVEKQRTKKPIILSEQSEKSEGRVYVAKCFGCPTCGNKTTYFGGLPNNCQNCGQAIDRSET